MAPWIPSPRSGQGIVRVCPVALLCLCFFCLCSSRVLGPLCRHLVLATGFSSRSPIVYVHCLLYLCANFSARGTRVSLSAVRGVGALRLLLIACCAYARLSLRVGLACPCLSCAELACSALSWCVRPCGPGSRWYRHCWPRKGARFFFLVQRDPCPTSAVGGQHDAFFGFLCPVVLLESYFTSPVLTTSQARIKPFPATLLMRRPWPGTESGVLHGPGKTKRSRAQHRTII